MSGTKKILLDTNVIIKLLSGEIKQDEVVNADEIFISFVSEIEYKCYEKFSEHERLKFDLFKNKVSVVYLSESSEELIQECIKLRKKYKLKLPDTIIAASARVHQAVLYTSDAAFSKIHDLKLRSI